MLKTLMLAAISAAMAAPDRCSDVGTANECAVIERCPEDNTRSCAWNTNLEACQCGRTCSMLTEEKCSNNECPDAEGEECVWNKVSAICQCGKSCSMFSEDDCSSKCPENNDEQCAWNKATKTCQCGKSCTMLSQDECSESKCPENS
ncbi:hypothetical protein DIPPA_52957, partial [Diplonema papillatum]